MSWMTVQLSVPIRNAGLDQIETVIGTSARLKIRTGAQPATCATADSGLVLADLSLPADYMNAASGGTKTLLGTWSAIAALSGAGGHFRIYDSTGTTCGMQGSVGYTGGPAADLVLGNTADTNLAAGQPFSISVFTITAGNA